jgi:hypothetical protein
VYHTANEWLPLAGEGLFSCYSLGDASDRELWRGRPAQTHSGLAAARSTRLSTTDTHMLVGWHYSPASHTGLQLETNCCEWSPALSFNVTWPYTTNKFIAKLSKNVGARGSVVGWGTMLQTGRSPVQVKDKVDFFNPSNRTMVLGSTQPLTKMSTRNLPGG